MDLTAAEYGALGVLGAHGTLSAFIFEGVDRDTADKIGRLPVGRGVLGAIRSSPLRLTDIATHPEAVGFPPHHPLMTSFLGVPVQLGAQTFGNLYLAEKRSGEFTEEDEFLVRALAVIAGSAVSRARLELRLERAALIEDRERIARDIHDGVIQELFAVGLSLQAAQGQEPELATTSLTKAIVSVDAAMEKLREFIFDLRSQAPDLEAQLRAIGAQAPRGIDVRVGVHGDFSGLTRPVATHLALFAREAVSNAVRHSDASAIVVTATSDGDTLTVSVTDDGSGFDPAVATPGMGLGNMSERLATIGGLFTLETAHDEGTTATATVPLT